MRKILKSQHTWIEGPFSSIVVAIAALLAYLPVYIRNTLSDGPTQLSAEVRFLKGPTLIWLLASNMINN